MLTPLRPNVNDILQNILKDKDGEELDDAKARLQGSHSPEDMSPRRPPKLASQAMGKKKTAPPRKLVIKPDKKGSQPNINDSIIQKIQNISDSSLRNKILSQLKSESASLVRDILSTPANQELDLHLFEKNFGLASTPKNPILSQLQHMSNFI
mmetsp:Transcript_33612/g.51769  ORF Transcript_33612/g.51769 Transcript_33612/m.51769 type:complete len:153 (-) Transcript_33612:1099-1557(-)